MILNPDLVALWNEERAAFAPPPAPRSAIEWMRSLIYPSGTKKGEPMDPESHRAHWFFLVAYCSGAFREFVIVGPTQDGKTTECVVVPILHSIVELREPVVYGLPDENVGQRQWIEKVEPILKISGFGHLMPQRGAGSRGGADVRGMMDFAGVPLTWMGSGGTNESGQSSVTARLVVIDESDSIKAGMVEKIRERNQAFGDQGIVVYSSTIKADAGSDILARLADSTDVRLWVPCPHCGRFQRFTVASLRYDPTDDITARDTARLVCAYCAALIDDAARKYALRRAVEVARGQAIDEAGALVGPAPRSLRYGILWSAFDSPLRSLGKIAVEHRRASVAKDTGDHEPMRQFYRDTAVEPYTGDVEDLDARKILDRAYLARRSDASTYGPVVHTKSDGAFSFYHARMPTGPEWIVATIDVQQDRAYFFVEGWDHAARTWDIAWGYESFCEYGRESSVPELHAGLDRIDARVELGPDGEGWGIPIVRRGIDVGYRQNDIAAWKSTHPRWVAIKGAGDEQADKMAAASKGEKFNRGAEDLAGVISLRQVPGLLIAYVEVDIQREAAQSAYLRPVGEPGAAHLPKGLKSGDSLIGHLVSRRLEIDPRTGKRIWHVEQKRRDYLDTRTYAHALGRYHLWTLTRPRTAPPARRTGVVGRMF